MTAANSHSGPDEIDLFVLAERSILFFKKYLRIFLIAALLGLAVGFYFYRSIPRTFKSRMIVHSFILTNQEEIQIVKNWNELLIKNEYTTLSSILNTPADLLKKVKKIKGEKV